MLSSRQKEPPDLPSTDYDGRASVWVLSQGQASAAKLLLQQVKRIGCWDESTQLLYRRGGFAVLVKLAE